MVMAEMTTRQPLKPKLRPRHRLKLKPKRPRCSSNMPPSKPRPRRSDVPRRRRGSSSNSRRKKSKGLPTSSRSNRE